MDWTAERKTTLRNWVNADPVWSLTAPNDERAAQQIAAALNQLASPTWTVWRMAVSRDEIMQSTSRESTNFIFAGNGYITRAVGERDCWRDLFGDDGTINPSKANVQTAINDIFSGTGNAALNRTHIQAVCKKDATVAEKLFSTGTGSLAQPATTVLDQPVSASDVLNARNA